MSGTLHLSIDPSRAGVSLQAFTRHCDEVALRRYRRELAAREAEVLDLYGDGRLCARTVPGHDEARA